jgi:aspartyl-tRNA(Asn)/glutamyl-tRNA(Gln) amidotransferase subunit A
MTEPVMDAGAPTPTAAVAPLPRTVSEAAAQLRSGEVTAVELTRSALAAIERTQPDVNAFITVTPDLALADAARADEELRAGHDRGPLHGIPLAIKDVFDVAGVPTTAGSAILRDAVADADAAPVQLLREAGGVVVGKANMDQFAIGPHMEDFGNANCPADTARYAGGSSGGSAAAVAAGCALGSIGSDAGASVRYPAALCGVVGLKPTSGRVPTRGTFPTFPTLDHVGPMANDVAGVAAVLAAVAPGFDAAAASPAQTAPRLGVVPGLRGPYHDATVDLFEACLAQLRDAGAEVAERPLRGCENTLEPLIAIVVAEGAVELEEILATDADRMPPALRELFAGAKDISATDYVRAQQAREPMRAEVDAALDGVEVLLTPCTREPAQRWDLPGMGDFGMGPHLPLFNLTGHPALSLPMPRAAGELPLGMQLIARRGDDERLLAIAAWCERVLAAD